MRRRAVFFRKKIVLPPKLEKMEKNLFFSDLFDD